MTAQHVPAPGSHVLISGGKKAGTVTRLITAGRGDAVSGFVVRYGWRKRKAKVVPIEDVKWVNAGSVVLTLSRRQFDALADWNPTEESDTAAAESGSPSGMPARRPTHP